MEDVILLPRLMNLITTVGPAIKDSRVRARLESLVLGTLCGKNPKTITSILAFDAECGNQTTAWTTGAPSTVFHSHPGVGGVFSTSFPSRCRFARKASRSVLIDDTLVRKTG